MASRVAVISIILKNSESVNELNSILHTYSKYIIGRMGIPYRERNINIISLAIDAPQDVISALSGKIGRMKGVSAKTAFTSVVSEIEDE
jgi:putative iron-only hydrogenase system regulator